MNDDDIKIDTSNKFRWKTRYLEQVASHLKLLSLNSLDECDTVTDMIWKGLESNFERNSYFNSLKACEKEVAELVKA
jgi:hypothetical protein